MSERRRPVAWSRIQVARASVIALVPASKKTFNPFYVLLVLTGVAFCVTACAYGVMTVRGLHAATEIRPATQSGLRLMDWLDKNGFRLMMIEIGILAMFTFAAIATDEFWAKRTQPTQDPSAKGTNET